MNRHGALTVICILVAVTLSGCGASFTPTFRPNVGDKRTIEQMDNMTVAMQVMGQSIPSSMSNNAVFTCEVTGVDEAGAISLKFTIDQVRADLGEQIQQQMAAGGMDANWFKQAQEVLKGQSFSATVTPAGEVTRLEGADEMVQAASAKLTVPAGMPGMSGQQLMEQSFGEPMLRKLVESLMTPYQNIELKPGGTWEKTGNSNLGMIELPYTQTHTLTAIENGIAKISFERKMGSGGMDVMGSRVNLEPEGGATGTMEMDVATGWIKTVFTDTSMTAAVNMPGMPSEMSMNLQITGSSSVQAN